MPSFCSYLPSYLAAANPTTQYSEVALVLVAALRRIGLPQRAAAALLWLVVGKITRITVRVVLKEAHLVSAAPLSPTRLQKSTRRAAANS